MKKGSDRSSRGYCGWHRTWNGNNVYLRSKLEYIVALYLDEIKENYYLEKVIYDIDNKKYKPDFFIYSKNILVKIIEVKYSLKEAEKYKNLYKKFFDLLGIKYEVLYKKNIDDINKKFNFKERINEWIDKSSSILHDMRGNKNPHYNIKHSKDSKKKIGLKTKERFKNEIFRKKHKEGIRKSFNQERRRKMSENMKDRWKEGKFENVIENNTKYIKHKIEKVCPECKKIFAVLKCYEKINNIFSHYESIGNKCNKIKGIFCTTKCCIKNKRRKEKQMKKEKQINEFVNFYVSNKKYPNRREFVDHCKINNIQCDIRSTFGKMKNMIKYMEDKYGKTFES